MKNLPNIVLLFSALFLGFKAYEFFLDPNSEYGVIKGRMEALETEIATKTQTVAAAKDFYSRLEAKRGEIRTLNEKLIGYKATLSETLDLPGFMKAILYEADRIGISLKSLTPDKNEKKNYYIEQTFDVTYAGVYVQLIAFLDRLSKSERIFRVDQFSIRPRGNLVGNSRFREIEGDLKIKTYLYLGSQEDQIASGTNTSGVAPENGAKL